MQHRTTGTAGTTGQGRNGGRSWRGIAAVVLGIGLAGASASCSSDPDADAAPAAAASVTGEDVVDYPRSAPTIYGDLELEQAPENIVALQPEVADIMLSLGVEPVAVAADPATLDKDTPYLPESLKEVSDPKLWNPYLDKERLAGYHADLAIGGKMAASDKADWEAVNEGTPLFIPDVKDWASDFEGLVRSIGDVLGRSGQAEKVIAETNATYDAAKEKLPDADGKTFSFVYPYNGNINFGFSMLLNMLGLTEADKPAAGNLSMENLGELDADVLMVQFMDDDGYGTLTSDARWNSLPAVENGTVFYAVDDNEAVPGAFGPLGLDWALDRILPTLEKL